VDGIVIVQLPNSDEPKGRILRFRQRGASPFGRYFRRAETAPARDPGGAPIDDLARYERSDEADDYRHRMMMNALSVLVVALLIGAGVWIANTMAEMRRNQDCFLQGRKNCTPIEVTTHDR
jgi:hypothetical protein